jgi:hypothetical protein
MIIVKFRPTGGWLNCVHPEMADLSSGQTLSVFATTGIGILIRRLLKKAKTPDWTKRHHFRMDNNYLTLQYNFYDYKAF